MSVTLVPSDLAPAEAVHYTFSTAEFDLGGRTKKYVTDDLDVVREASTHPWLSVAPDPDAENQAAEPVGALDDDSQNVAIEAGLTQTVEVTTEEVAETLAADSTSKTSKKKD